jgi:hypothetical protein
MSLILSPNFGYESEGKDIQNSSNVHTKYRIHGSGMQHATERKKVFGELNPPPCLLVLFLLLGNIFGHAELMGRGETLLLFSSRTPVS